MPHFVEPSLVYQVLRVVAYATPCGAYIFLILLYDKYFYINHQTIIWLMYIELNVPILIICLFLANTNIIWWYFHWNLYICNNLFMCTFTYWIALLTKPVFEDNCMWSWSVHNWATYIKVCGSYAFTPLNWTPTIEWYMASVEVNTGYQNGMCSDEVPLQVWSWTQMGGRTYDHLKRNRTSTLTSYKFCILTSIHIVYLFIPVWNDNLWTTRTNKMKDILIQSNGHNVDGVGSVHNRAPSGPRALGN